MLFRNLLALSLFMVSGAVAAQGADERALDEMDRDAPKAAPIVNEPLAASQLRDAMRRIASSPQDASALTDAGYASLALGDPNAALNFLTRANGARPRDARITAGLGEATVRTENPFEALRLFDDAVRLGIDERKIAFDRGLAFDLLGNFARAQQDYQLARSQGVTDELIIRHAISLSLSGKTQESDIMLDPLLKRGVPEAWRTRTFLLGARGEYREASKLAQDFLDPSLLPKTQRYLGLMPKLTGAQQAAALHLGHFPANHQIGHDSEEIKRIAATFPAQGPQVAKGDARLIPAGKPLGAATPIKKTKEQLKQEQKLAEAQKKEREKQEKALAKKKADEAKKLAASARRKDEPQQNSKALASKDSAKPADAKPIKVAQVAPPPATIETLPKSNPSTQIVYLPETARVPVEQNVVVVPPQAPSENSNIVVVPSTGQPQRPVIQPAFDTLAQRSTELPPASGQTAEVNKVTPNPVVDAPAEKFDLAAIVAAIKVPESETKPSIEAVDLATIRQPSAKPVKPAVKTVSNTDPRYWVQIATGSDSILDDEFRRLSRKQPELFSAKQGWSSSWSAKSSRLLVGPFDTMKDAKQWESEFRGGGGDGFAWRNDAGVAVTPLGVAAPVKAASKPAVQQSEKPAPKQAGAKTPAKGTPVKEAASKPKGNATTVKNDSKQSGKASNKQPAQQNAKQTGTKSSTKQAESKSVTGKQTVSKKVDATKGAQAKSKQADTKSENKAPSKTSSKQSATGSAKQATSSKNTKASNSKATDKPAAKRSGTQPKSK